MRYRQLIALLLLAGLCVTASAQTPIHGNLSGSLILDESPYLLANTGTVLDSDTLTIEAGVEIFVADINQQVTLIVAGTLIVESTPDSMITFRAYFPEDPADITWNGVMYFQSGSIDPDTTSFSLHDVYIYNAFFGVRVIMRTGEIAIHHNVFANCRYGLYLINTSNVWFYHNTLAGIDPNAYAIAFTNYHLPPEQFVIENNIISDASLGAYFFWSDYQVHPDDIIINYNCFDVDSMAVYYYDTGMPFDTLSNIFEDPLFYGNTFRLQDDSPCIDAGNHAYPWDPDGTLPDMGAFWFNQSPECANYDHIVPDTIAVADHRYFDYILAAGNPTPVNEPVSLPPGMSYDTNDGLLEYFPTLADTGISRVALRAWNFVNDSLCIDTLEFDLHVVPNTAPYFVSWSPICEDEMGDTSLCRDYFPMETVELEVVVADAENDPITIEWFYDTQSGSGETFVITLLHEGDNWVECQASDGADATSHYWNFIAGGECLEGLITYSVLTEEDGPYVLCGTAWVGEGDTLTVEPGVKLFISISTVDAALQVYGYLRVSGSADNPVRFFASDPTDYLWQGIHILPEALGAELSHLEIYSAERAVFSQFPAGPLLISHCEFLYDSIAVQVHYTDLEIRNSVFDEIAHYAIFVEGDNFASITNCGFCSMFDPIYLYRGNAEVINNTFAIGLPALNPSYHLHPLTVLASELRAVNNIFLNYYDVALFVDNEYTLNELAYNCFYLSPPGSPWPAPVCNDPEVLSENSLFADPMLVIPGECQLELQPGSPCIDSGAPYLLDPDDSRSDMGMFGGPGADSPQPAGHLPPPTLPAYFELTRIFPNPFNASTHIDFALSQGGHTRLDVFNLRGQHVTCLLNDFTSPGRYIFTFDGMYHASGIYLVRLQQGNEIATGKMLLVK